MRAVVSSDAALAAVRAALHLHVRDLTNEQTFSSMIVLARDLRLRGCKRNVGFGLLFHNREEHG